MTNFIDSDNNTSGVTSDADFLNHPGFLGGTWWKDFWQPGKAEDERYDSKYSSIKSQCPYTGGDSCADLDDAYWCYQDIKDASSGSHRTDNRAEQTQLQFLQMQQMQMQKEQEYDKSKTSIMLVAGGAVALTLLVVMIK